MAEEIKTVAWKCAFCAQSCVLLVNYRADIPSMENNEPTKSCVIGIEEDEDVNWVKSTGTLKVKELDAGVDHA
jgi:hypothetical protein